MYVKLYTKILDSSIAGDRRLRHFFTDLLLCADPDGNIIMTKEAIVKRTGATMEEVEWGLEQLMSPDPRSFTTEYEGRRIVPLDGLGYGWRIVSYASYRDFKTANEMRADTAARVARFRARKSGQESPAAVVPVSKVKRKPTTAGLPIAGENAYGRAVERGDGSEGKILDAMAQNDAERVNEATGI